MTTLSEDDAAERGLEEQTRGVAQKPDPGWDYNVGKVGLDSYKPDLSKYPTDLSNQYLSDEEVWK